LTDFGASMTSEPARKMARKYLDTVRCLQRMDKVLLLNAVKSWKWPSCSLKLSAEVEIKRYKSTNASSF